MILSGCLGQTSAIIPVTNTEAKPTQARSRHTAVEFSMYVLTGAPLLQMSIFHARQMWAIFGGKFCIVSPRFFVTTISVDCVLFHASMNRKGRKEPCHRTDCACGSCVRTKLNATIVQNMTEIMCYQRAILYWKLSRKRWGH